MRLLALAAITCNLLHLQRCAAALAHPLTWWQTHTLPHRFCFQLIRHEDYWPRPNEWLPERWLPENKEEMAPHADACFSPFTGALTLAA